MPVPADNADSSSIQWRGRLGTAAWRGETLPLEISAIAFLRINESRTLNPFPEFFPEAPCAATLNLLLRYPIDEENCRRVQLPTYAQCNSDVGRCVWQIVSNLSAFLR